MSAFEDAVEAAGDSVTGDLLGHGFGCPPLDIAQQIGRNAVAAALLVLLDGLDRGKIADLLEATEGMDIEAQADAVIAHLRDEFGVTT